MDTCFIVIGSNLGDRNAVIEKALACLKSYKGITVERVSSIIETKPEGGVFGPDYLNAVVKIKTVYQPDELLVILQNIETELGRVRGVRFKPRTIDLDILLYSDMIIDTPCLKVPHPRMFERAFVLEPLFEIEPGMRKYIKMLENRVARK